MEQQKEREKEKVDGRPAKLNGKKKNKGDIRAIYTRKNKTRLK